MRMEPGTRWRPFLRCGAGRTVASSHQDASLRHPGATSPDFAIVERPSSLRAAMASSAVAPVTQRFRWDALQLVLLVVLFLQVWRIQPLRPGGPPFLLPILAAAAAGVLF